MIELPLDTLYSDDILYYAEKLQIPNFIGVFMSDELPTSSLQEESGVLNLQNHTNIGSHWIAWRKSENNAWYFDSYSEPPDSGLKAHLGKIEIKQSAITVQKDTTKECGSQCLFVLYYLSRGCNFSDILYTLQQRYRKKEQSPLIINTDI